MMCSIVDEIWRADNNFFDDWRGDGRDDQSVSCVIEGDIGS